MVERRILDPDFVNETLPPAKGERWVADTQIKGFGLRLWSTPNGGSKAFAIRAVDPEGSSTRLTFDTRTAWNAAFAARMEDRAARLGDCLEEARQWARDEIDRLKGRSTLRDEEHAERLRASHRIRGVPLGRAKDSVLRGMRSRNLSQAYIDRLDKLFSLAISGDLQSRPLGKISANDITDALVNSPLRPTNVVVLRAFLGQIFERASTIGGRAGPGQEEISQLFWPKWREQRDVRYPELRNLPRQTYLDMFAVLEGEKIRWQQALAIRLYFEFKAPLSAILSAQWSQIVNRRWYPYTRDQRVYWHAYRENIEEKQNRLLNRVRRLCRAQYGDARYWFPSRASRNVPYIRTVDGVWQNTLHLVGLRYYPLREFSRSYRELNCPSHYIGFLRQYSAMLEDMEIAAKLSKRGKHK